MAMSLGCQEQRRACQAYRPQVAMLGVHLRFMRLQKDYHNET
jgi:hypothetical protein